ncbi:response regulator receiver protein [Leptolyngbya sp. Heron Island J]|uniref:response regulator n=1 Tax=Leptolyngbya sp. Heron Island J TaxID=1385935 RepID=UPI0003B9B8D4|nr:response regulator [Leptolyngbya sp. Heron Island J]ESA34006.1 response regulator receiver protein [Leptolyngbya sp. Heron Island J]
MREPNKTPLIVVEDSDEDFEVLQLFMEDMAVANPIYRFTTGDKALDFLYRGQYKSAETATWPSMILLDLNLPGTDGREVLERLKQDEQFREIPIVIFTTNSDPRDIKFCYRKGANGYLIKPVRTEQFEKAVQAFVDYWLNTNTPPEWVELTGIE